MAIKPSITLLLILLPVLFACSDSGDSPTGGDTDGPATVRILDESVTEGSNANFTVILSKTVTNNVVLSYRTADVSALATEDYTAIALTEDTILAGATNLSIVVITQDDSEIDSTETFNVILSNVTGATVADSIGVGTIVDNDAIRYSTQVRGILMASCAKIGCHGGGSSQGGMALGNAAYSTVINAIGTNYTGGGKVIVPFDANGSMLYRKVLPTADPLFPGPSRMPADGPPYLTTDQINRIRDWINQGAKDN